MWRRLTMLSVYKYCIVMRNIDCCVFRPAFRCCVHLKAGQNLFFSRFQAFLFNFYLFQCYNYMRTRQYIFSTWNTLHFHYTIIISNFTTITSTCLIWLTLFRDLFRHICVSPFSHFRFMLPIHYMKLLWKNNFAW